MIQRFKILLLLLLALLLSVPAFAQLEDETSAGNVSTQFGFVVINTTPMDGTTVFIDGEEMSVKTPFVSDRLSVGQHIVRVEKETYKPYVTVIDIEDGKIIRLDVELKEAFGSLKIITQPENAKIKIGTEYEGLTQKVKEKTPVVLDSIRAGDYRVKLSKYGYDVAVCNVTIVNNETVVIEDTLERATRTRGWTIVPEIVLSVPIKFNKYIPGLILVQELNLDYNLGPRFGIGVGSGCAVAKPQFVPLFVHFIFSFNKKNICPYINAKMGYNISVSSKKTSIGKYLESELSIGGFYASLSFGANSNESRFGLTFTWYQAFETKNVHEDHIFFYRDYTHNQYYMGFAFGLSYSYRFSFR